MTQRPLVSAVIPAYNASSTIDRCLLSVFADGTQRLECVVVDDGSVDNTAEVVTTFCESYPDCSIRLVRQENAGVSVARNRGIEEASGDWITFVDADDVLCAGWLSTIYDATVTYPRADVIIFSGSANRGVLDATDCLRGCLSSKKRPGSIVRSALCCPFAKAYARVRLGERDIRFPEGIRTGEDMLFNAMIYVRDARIFAWPKSIYVYRKQMGSVTNRADARYLQNELSYHLHLVDILARSNLSEVEQRDIVLENCLGGVLGVIGRSLDATKAMEDLLSSESGADYREALDRLPDFVDRFSRYQMVALRLAAAGRISAAGHVTFVIRRVKELRYAAAGGIVEERI